MNGGECRALEVVGVSASPASGVQRPPVAELLSTDADAAPQETTITLGLFNPGAFGNVHARAIGPALEGPGSIPAVSE